MNNTCWKGIIKGTGRYLAQSHLYLTLLNPRIFCHFQQEFHSDHGSSGVPLALIKPRDRESIWEGEGGQTEGKKE